PHLVERVHHEADELVIVIVVGGRRLLGDGEPEETDGRDPQEPGQVPSWHGAKLLPERQPHPGRLCRIIPHPVRTREANPRAVRRGPRGQAASAVRQRLPALATPFSPLRGCSWDSPGGAKGSSQVAEALGGPACPWRAGVP